MKRDIKSYFELFLISLRLGLTSFGGPVAHLGYFHEEYVRKRKWMDEKGYADLVALAQFLPGPASSQVGIGIGVIRAGVLGGFISFLGFTLPSALALIIFALVIQGTGLVEAGWINGLKIVAVVVVAHAIIGMGKKLTPDLQRKTIALVALVVTLVWQSAFTQVTVIIIAAIIGVMMFQKVKHEQNERMNFPISRRFALGSIGLFIALLIFLPIVNELTSSKWIALFDQFYRSGALVFGGGHVVLPLLQQEFVATGWLTEQQFLTGYGAAQAVPGPLFTFAAYIGAVVGGWQGGLLGIVAIFLPAFLLIFAALPFWNSLRQNPKMKGALMGVNAAVVGILISAFYQPIFTSSIKSPIDFALAAILFTLLVYYKMAPWIIVLLGAVGGFLIGL
ncbi:chromate transporter [Bacillus carboniphilus]|uniref:Chromate transporter n=1 Tax=Bacillus carboniphilus TaxID=86663 RepID=A0ABY9JRY4_9BACI|nr:chromate transporter [Bacillus carboniphilus]WLR42172.1 chromate transporter [Bacillus carboniphilus]